MTRHGTRVIATLQNAVNAQASQVGDRFTMEVTSPYQYRGAVIEGRITNAERSGRVSGRASLSFEFDSIRMPNGSTYRFAGNIDSVRAANGDNVSVNNEGTVRDSNQTTKTATRARIGAALGALIGAIAGGYSLFGAAIAVGLSSIRLMPMVAAFVPEMRGPKTRKITLLFLSHFIAVTAWVMGMDRLKHVPRDMRTSYFAGLGITLTLTNTLVVAVVYVLSTDFPPLVFAALFFLTPMYFLTSLWGSARDRSVHVAMVSGLLLFPVIHSIAPAYDLLLTGVAGGIVTMAYVHLAKRSATG